MARLPSYLKIEGVRREGTDAVFSIKVQAWRPSFWRMFTKEVLLMAKDRGISRWNPRLWWAIVRELVRMTVRR